MADTPAKPKAKTQGGRPSKWAEARPQADPIAEKHRKLWKALHEFIKENSGFVVSPPGAQNLRIEVPERSPLPGKLIELGYRPLNIGQATRLTNKPSASSPWVVVDVIAISLPR